MTAHDPLPRRTPLYETHRRLGAAMPGFAGWTIATGYVDTALAAPGTAVQVDVRDAAEAARVVELPFYRRPRGVRGSDPGK